MQVDLHFPIAQDATKAGSFAMISPTVENTYGAAVIGAVVASM